MQTSSVLNASLAFLLGQATERAAIAAHREAGRGDETAADEAAAAAMRAALNLIPMAGRIVVGAAEEDTGAVLCLGEKLGSHRESGMGGPELDIALDPLEGTTLTAKSMPNAVSVIAATARGHLMRVPNLYMEKLAVGPGFARDVVDLDAPAGENAKRLARAKGVDVSEITACVLDRPRHDKIIADLRNAGARIKLISEGDVAGVINAADPMTGIDMYVGQGGAPEGVLAAAALRCVGGQFQGRLVIRADGDRGKAERAGISDYSRRYAIDDLVSGEAVFAATGVTNGTLLNGVKRSGVTATAHTLVMSSFDGMVRRVTSTGPAVLA